MPMPTIAPPTVMVFSSCVIHAVPRHAVTVLLIVSALARPAVSRYNKALVSVRN